MTAYRAYQIKNNHIDGVPVVIVSNNDNEAIEQARRLLNGHDIELWEGARFVIGIQSKDVKK